MIYTTTIRTTETGSEVWSRAFQTKKAAVKWFGWLKDQSMTLSASLYQGRPGEYLLERYTKEVA